MPRSHGILFGLSFAALLSLAAGCQTNRNETIGPIKLTDQPRVAPARQTDVLPVAYLQGGGSAATSASTNGEPPAPVRVARQPCADDLFAGAAELDPDQLVAEVLRRNPSLEAMVGAWQAAVARYPQVVSLEDPMLSLAMGPGTFGDPNHDVAWMIEGSQKIPWCGKRELRGRLAQAEASAAHWEVDDATLKLAEATKTALADYYLADRGLAFNAEGLRLMQSFREDADARYRNNLVTQQDILQADLELSELRRRQFELERMRRVAVARLNTLLHRLPDARLPAPGRLPEGGKVAALEAIEPLAAARRPDLMALAARVQAEQAAVGLAERDYYPDLNFIGRYDAFWQKADKQLAPMVGVNMNVPLDNPRREGAVREAQFRLNQRRAEYEARLDEIRNDLTAAYQQLEESRRAIELYRDRALPVAEDNLTSARANYSAGKIDFLRLIEAERQLVVIREKREQAVADYYRAMADYERAAGGPVLQAPASELIPPGKL